MAEDAESVDMTEKYRQIFDIFDQDQSGSVDTQELGAGLRALGCNPTSEEIQAMIEEVDGKVLENGKLEFAEFCEVMSRHYKNAEDVQTELLKAFMFFDKNGDGTVDKDELREALKQYGFDKLTDEDVDVLFAEADVDENDRISYQELVRVMCKP